MYISKDQCLINGCAWKRGSIQYNCTKFYSFILLISCDNTDYRGGRWHGPKKLTEKAQELHKMKKSYRKTSPAPWESVIVIYSLNIMLIQTFKNYSTDLSLLHSFKRKNVIQSFIFAETFPTSKRIIGSTWWKSSEALQEVQCILSV